LVRAWLKLPGIAFKSQTCVTALRKQGGLWEVLGSNQQVLCTAEHVVLANACGALELLNTCQQDQVELATHVAHLPAMHGMRGLLSWAKHTRPPEGVYPPHPVNGSGSIVPDVPMDGGSAWFMGSSYQPANQTERSDQANHDINYAHLQQLLPQLAKHLSADFSTYQVHCWKGTRCVTSDRLPAVGPVEAGPNPSLWMCAGLGSRGLSFSVLCAELLAARWGAEPLPVPAHLARLLVATRS
jgi:tRNA 5-methylaminomethyl-2-thiouridine biosynthesis bifunctional protein